MCNNITEKLINTHRLSQDEYMILLRQWEDPVLREKLRQEAVSLQKQHYGTDVYIRGLIEFTNYCKNNCNYCGIRCGNKHVNRYRLSKEQIMSCCKKGYELGFRTIVLQGGEDPHYDRDRMSDLISSIKEAYPDIALTLSVGEKDEETYKAWRMAGADRYLLRHEAADRDLYQSLHPGTMDHEKRLYCLATLKKLGYQTGAGFMVGAPGQTLSHLATDLFYLQELQPEMVGIGPFIPHKDTMYKIEPAGSKEMTLFLLSVIRIMLPKVLLPATTALGTVSGDGRQQGLLHGANVIMPNLSPEDHRKDYSLYDNKITEQEEAAEHLRLLEEKVSEVGYHLVCARGDYPGQVNIKE